MDCQVGVRVYLLRDYFSLEARNRGRDGQAQTFLVACCRSAGLGRTRLFYPWGREPEGVVVRLRCFRVARCQTWTILDSGQSPVMSHRDGF